MKRVLAIYDNDQNLKMLENHFNDIDIYNFNRSRSNTYLKDIAEINPHIAFLDIDLEHTDGFDICRKIKQEYGYNIIICFFTDKSEEYLQAHSFEVGADDYILNSIHKRVFLCRVNSLFRRIHNDISNDVMIFNNLIIDKDAYTVKIKGERINLIKKEFELLILLSSKLNRVFSRDEIMNKLWEGKQDAENNLNTLIHSLKKKIGLKYIETVRGEGYKFSKF